MTRYSCPITLPDPFPIRLANRLASGLPVAMSLVLAACAAKPIQPGAESVVVSSRPATPACRFLGEVQGAQGNVWLAQFTPDRELIAGARNELRNAAHAMGGNYVQLETESLSENTQEDALGGTHTVVVIGNAFLCPDPAAVLTGG